MEYTEKYNGAIWPLKYKFFFYRVVGYFSFLFIPLYTQKYVTSSQYLAFPMMVLYLFFLVGQWFLLGKEVDYRLKIFFKVNSNMDRIIYRLFLGMALFVIYFNFLNLFPPKWINNLYWVTWGLVGAFFSWPTRGKIIQESVSSNFTEFKYLDSFERTLLGLIILFFIFSMPQVAVFGSFSDLQNMIDPAGRISSLFWNFLKVNFYPFINNPKLLTFGVATFCYVIFLGSFLLTFYAMLRAFFSRRVSIMGVFAIISCWKYSTILMNDLGATIFSTYFLIWAWAMLWATRSLSYKTGLFVGFITFLGTLFNASFSLLMLIQIPLFYFVFFKDNTKWFKKQFLKYSSFGYLLVLFIILIDSSYSLFSFQGLSNRPLSEVFNIIFGKGFYILSLFGAVFLILKLLFKKSYFFSQFHFNMEKIGELTFYVAIYCILDMIFNMGSVKQYALIWPVVFLSLIPIEVFFQRINRLRSSRNFIYLTYILICLLDSRFEERVKIFIKMIEN